MGVLGPLHRSNSNRLHLWKWIYCRPAKTSVWNSCYLLPVSLFLCCLVMSKRKNRFVLCHRQIKYPYIFRAQKSSAFFCTKAEDLLPLFHKMSEGLLLYRVNAAVPEFTLDLHPAWTAHEWPGVVPLLYDVRTRTQRLKPQVQHLLTTRKFIFVKNVHVKIIITRWLPVPRACWAGWNPYPWKST